MLVGSPSCAPYCTFQYINEYYMSDLEKRRRRAAADVHMNFVVEPYRLQMGGGIYSSTGIQRTLSRGLCRPSRS